MIKFDLPNGWYVKQYDSFNWVTGKYSQIKDKTSKRYGQIIEINKFYFPFLRSAMKDVVETLALEAKDIKELKSIVDTLEKLKDEMTEIKL